jgi:hypothetical protein
MTTKLANEQLVIDAVRHLVEVLQAGRDPSKAGQGLIEQTSDLPLIGLDDWERTIRYALESRQSESLKKNLLSSALQLAQFWKLPHGESSWLDLCSGSGHQREKALRAMSMDTAGAPNAFFFAFALRRLNDWVPQVRAAAKLSLPLIAKNTDPACVVHALWHVLPHRHHWGRIGGSDMAVFDAILSIEPIREAMKTRIVESPTGPAAHILAQAGRSGLFDSCLAEFARDALQPAARAKSYQFLLDAKFKWQVGRVRTMIDRKWGIFQHLPVFEERVLSTEDQFLNHLSNALNDHSTHVRRVAAEYLIRKMDTMGATAIDVAHRVATDSNEHIAERGRFALKHLQNDNT